VRQNRQLRHDVYVSVDIVTAASPDALDLVSSASRINEAATIDVLSTLEVDADNEYSLRYSLHNEEHFRSFQLGAAFLSQFAQDNASVLFSVNLALDSFDPLTTRGRDAGAESRGALNFNLGVSQILSPTTLFDASYGLTAQLGTLETTWNSVPARKPAGRPGGPLRRISEALPTSRYRNAFGVRLAQHIPVSRTTVKGSYRFYIDTFELMANTAELTAYQYLVDQFYVRGSFRTHQQTGVDMYTELARVGLEKRTADSDLAPLVSREVGAKVLFYVSGGPVDVADDHAIDVAYYHYWRSNDLRVNMVSVGYAGQF